MSTRQSASAAAPASNALPLLLLLFVGSGLCALIYEVVWFQLLELVIGSSAISLGVLLATFMGGMCIGSLALPRLLPTHHHPLRVDVGGADEQPPPAPVLGCDRGDDAVGDVAADQPRERLSRAPRNAP